MIDPSVHYERRTHADAGDPQAPQMKEYSHGVHAFREERHVPLSPIQCIGIYQQPSQLSLSLADVSEGKDASLYGTAQVFTSDTSIRPLSQFDSQVFNSQDAFGQFGADIKMATHK